MALDLLMFGGSLYLLWRTYRTREELSAWKALQKRSSRTLSQFSGMLTEAIELATKQKQRIAALEAELDGRQ